VALAPEPTGSKKRVRESAAELQPLIERHLHEEEGTLLSAAPQWVLLRFDGPLRAIRAIHEMTRDIKLPTQAVVDVGCGGLPLELSAACERLRRLAARGAANAVLVTAAAKGLLAGSRLTFEDLGKPAGDAGGQTVPTLFQVALAEPAGKITQTEIRLRDRRRQPKLTRAQVGILQLVAEGRTNREIARLLSRSEHTVHRHVANILAELNVTSRAAAAAEATRLSII
jgi:DNA-binding CsgD family transcriptional regulator